MSTMTIGLVGLGKMGSGICANMVAKSGQTVRVFDIDSAAMSRAVDGGAQPAESVTDLIPTCEVLFSSLPTPNHVRDLATTLAEVARPGLVYFDLSTISPTVAVEVGAALAPHGVTMLDAPVSGGVQGAADGTLSVMVGGDRDSFDRHQELLKSFSKVQVHVGQTGAGSIVKLVNNMMGLCTYAACVEGIEAALTAGIDPDILRDVVQASTGDSPAFRRIMGALGSGDFEPGFTIDLAKKDVGLFVEFARGQESRTSVSAAAAELMADAQAEGLGGLDVVGLAKVKPRRL
jgi:2-hydroxy-3-oxopropionate reductase